MLYQRLCWQDSETRVVSFQNLLVALQFQGSCVFMAQITRGTMSGKFNCIEREQNNVKVLPCFRQTQPTSDTST